MVRAKLYGPIGSYNARPLQTGLGEHPWRVAVASMLLCRTRYAQARQATEALLNSYPLPELLARADSVDVELLVKCCGFHRNRSRQLIRFSGAYLGDSWNVINNLPGVGMYVSDAVGLFCFDITDLHCNDTALVEYAKKIRSERRCEDRGPVKGG